MTFRSVALALAVFLTTRASGAEPWVRTEPQAGDFPISTAGATAAAPIVYDAHDAKVVGLAAHDLAADIGRVTGRVPAIETDADTVKAPAAIVIGTLGQSTLIDRLVQERQLSVDGLRGAWESFVITPVAHPFPGIDQALVIAGTDRRGTAFGVYELSQAIGVSPWHWWADVAPARRSALYVAAGTQRFGPPSVKYRGVFLNDEDWGLEPWAAKTFEPEHGGIGPKTYAKLFELLLRLKANTVWPAMHPGTKPFNDFPENRTIADEYAIVMGSSHAEPMLRNNVGEWKQPPAGYNYVTNRAGVRAYWEERMKQNGGYENIYTIGMRGVHDSGIQGAKTDAQRIQILEQVFADQRALIAQYAHPTTGASLAGTDGSTIPQMFCAYKEVLGLYRQGLKVPEDVTIVWPDDNFGYVRNFATAEEQRRPGGFGVYYHLSYLGAPMAYLWLYTTPPALVWEEMTKAYDHGARTIWIANVGDLKPAEIGTELFLRLAWDVHAYNAGNTGDFLDDWARREFPAGAGEAAAPASEIAAILREYYALNFQRKPEHLQGWLPKQTPRPSPFTREETEARLAAFARLRSRVQAVGATLPSASRDAFFELVAYPVLGSALANERYFYGELSGRTQDAAERARLAEKATAADAELRAQTTRYNEEIAGGKWRGLMNLEPADEQWKSFRLEPWRLRSFDAAPAPTGAAADSAGTPGPTPARPQAAAIAIEAEHFGSEHAGKHGRWQIIRGLGRTGDSVAVFPTKVEPINAANAGADAPALEYPVSFPAAGTFHVIVYVLPTHPLRAEDRLRFAIALDDAAPREVVVNIPDGSAGWAQGVLNETYTVTTPIEVPAAGPHRLRVYGTDAGVVLDKIVIDLGGLQPSYLGPPEK